MKIGFEVQRLFRKKKYGIETASLELIKKLQELQPAGYQFVIFTKDDVDRNCLSPSPNFKIRTVAGRLFADFEHFFLPMACRRENVDLLHCTGNTTPYLNPVPIVQTLHDIIFMDPIPRNDSWYQRLGNHYRRRMVPLVASRNSAIITVSNYEKARIISRLGVSENKIEVIYNGINEKHYRLCQDPEQLLPVRERYRLPENYILFLGNATGRKNPVAVIEAYAMYASKTANPLPLVTPGLESKFVVGVLRQLGVPYDPSRFVTPGYVRDEDLPSIYASSALFLFPSLSEGFGMPVIEAMACGTPVITSKISCMPEIAGDAALLVDPLSPPSIAEGMIQILTDQELRSEKVQDGLINARRFSWTRTAEQVLAVYEKILHPARSIKAVDEARNKQVFESTLYFSNRPRLQ